MFELTAEFTVPFVHRLRCTQGVFDPDNRTLVDLLEPIRQDVPARVLVFLDAGLMQAQPQLPQAIERYADAHSPRMTLAGRTRIIPGGEAVKNEPRGLEPMLQAIDEAHLCRRSYVIAIGGGAVLDAVGFCASMAHRGVRLIRIASTTLSQTDSVLGVKNGINAFGKKNYLGAFDVPWAVINDEAMLATLTPRDWLSGFSEAVKVALLKDAALFELLRSSARQIAHRELAAAIPVIRRSAQLHFEHITRGGDPFELTAARPLDFGHWAAHRLEHMTRYQLPHGHAVALGMAIDLTYAHCSGWLSAEDHQRILGCMTEMGFSLYHKAMRDGDDLLAGLEEFREHLGGAMAIPMVARIGESFDVQSIDRPRMLKAIRQLVDAHE